jgi:hypothetical protein
MTPEEKMQKIVEAAGECWHDVEEFAGETMGHYYLKCTKCGVHDKVDDDFPCNHSPTDLNELFRLAEKIGYKDMDFYKDSSSCTIYPSKDGKPYRLIGSIRATGSTPAEALLNALYEAVS